MKIDYNKLIKSIPNKLFTSQDQIGIARFLYIELGKYFIYDPEIIETKDNDKRLEIANRDINDIKNNRVVCFSLARIYTELLQRCGIDARTVIIPPTRPDDPKDIGHAYTKIRISEKEGSLCLINDLNNIKVGFKTEHFLPEIPEEKRQEAEARGLTDKLKTILTVDESRLRDIDDKIGYTYNGKYLNDIVEEMKDKFYKLSKEPEFSTMSEQEWIEFQVENISKNMGHTNLGCIEKSNYFIQVIKQCIGEDAGKKYFDINKITCFDKNGHMNIFCIIDRLDGSKRNIYSINNEGEILILSQEDINEKLNNGLEILSKKNKDEYLEILSNSKNDGKKKSDISQRIKEMSESPEVKAKFVEALDVFKSYTRYIESREGCDWVHDE